MNYGLPQEFFFTNSVKVNQQNSYTRFFCFCSKRKRLLDECHRLTFSFFFLLFLQQQQLNKTEPIKFFPSPFFLAEVDGIGIFGHWAETEESEGDLKNRKENSP
jgi:hypothetical protein